MFEKAFLNSAANYTDHDTCLAYWNEIQIAYSDKCRSYHTLSHLNDLYLQLLPFQNEFTDWDIILFAIAYHDIIYSAGSSDNEEQSARLASERLTTLGADSNKAQRCVKLIRATKRHEFADNETNLFTDADLSILGSSAEKYKWYAHQVRNEYSNVPDKIYITGRKKVLEYFLSMHHIYKTEVFYIKYESQARLNIKMELSGLV